MIAVPRSLLIFFKRSKTCSCTSASSAVVGSSAIRRAGSHMSAIAIMTLCCCPPESSCGYFLYTTSGSGRSTASNISMTFFFRSSFESILALPSTSLSLSCAWSVSISSTCLPTRSSGFSEVIGSWKTTESSSPFKVRSSSKDIGTRSCPWKRTCPV